MPERELHKLVWKKFTEGDQYALVELYNQHYTGLINYGRKLINEQEFVNECLMDMLIGLWEKRASLPPVENVRSYLITSFRRVLIHTLEADKRRYIKEKESTQTAETVQWSYEDYLVNQQTNTELKNKLAAAMNKLTARQKELLRLKFFEDLDYDAIAEQCGISKRTAYNIIYDAIKILKAELYTGHGSSYPQNFPCVFLLVAASIDNLPAI